MIASSRMCGIQQTFTRRRKLAGYKVGKVHQKSLLFIYF